MDNITQELSDKVIELPKPNPSMLLPSKIPTKKESAVTELVKAKDFTGLMELRSQDNAIVKEKSISSESISDNEEFTYSDIENEFKLPEKQRSSKYTSSGFHTTLK